MTENNPESTLDSILYDNIWNNRAIERLEGMGWKIAYATPEFVLRDPDGVIYNLRVEFVPGSLTAEDIQQFADEGEWDIDDDDWDDEDD